MCLSNRVHQARLTLEPGDVIATGTPGGVGFSARGPAYLQHGDEVEVFIERGSLENQVCETATASNDASAVLAAELVGAAHCQRSFATPHFCSSSSLTAAALTAA
jgi:fumarylacetoacetase-like protein